MTSKIKIRASGEAPLSVKYTSDFSFVFSDDIKKWQRKRTMSQEVRFNAKKKRQPKPDTMTLPKYGFNKTTVV